AGAAVYSGIEDENRFKTSNQCEIAYRKARGGDELSSFGDFIAVSGVVNAKLAKYIKTQVSDGIIAQDYTPEAHKILSKKKNASYVMLQGHYCDPRTQQQVEYRELGGIALSQPVNKEFITFDDLSESKIVTNRTNFTIQEKNDLLLASICLKFAQSNNVGLVWEGQIIGLSAGQQSRIHSVRLAVRKAKVWLLKNDPKIKEIFKSVDIGLKDGIQHQLKANTIIRIIEHLLGDTLTKHERKDISGLFGVGYIPEDVLTRAVRGWEQTHNNKICAASDAFFPFRDNIDSLSKIGVTAIAQPGGSIRDQAIIDACDEYNIAMACHGKRMFTH
ncbi:MAG: phosphoribosylaminoimidazolecarboxamide formyltransferase, partial [Candidatus Heimdallarchaeota archaeon]|nr:phosphoribosylaminoimidazolecarboxamide formyltransferase [Candidatus Heimdallarchaeota archaeon]